MSKLVYLVIFEPKQGNFCAGWKKSQASQAKNCSAWLGLITSIYLCKF